MIKYRMYQKLIFCFILISCSAGCARVPRQEAGLPDIVGAEADQIRRSFAGELSDNFTVVSTVVFKYKLLSFSALGVTRINEPANEFEATGMTPVGVKLFELSSKDGAITGSFVMPDLAARGDVCSAVSTNIRRVYFSRVPPEGAQVVRRGRFLVYSVPFGNESTEYLFGKENENMVLLQKRHATAGKRDWDVSYHAYSYDKQNKLHPQYIVFTHHGFSFRLLLRVKEIRT